jgi:hypothetical protein
MVSLVSVSTSGFIILFLLVFKDILCQNLYYIYYLLIFSLFLHLNSPQEIREKILGFFDIIIAKLRTSQEDITPLESCQCEEILEMVVLPLAQHFLALGEKNKALYYFLEIASAYVILHDNYMVSCFYQDLFHSRDNLETAQPKRKLQCAFYYFLLVPASTPFL